MLILSQMIMHLKKSFLKKIKLNRIMNMPLFIFVQKSYFFFNV